MRKWQELNSAPLDGTKVDLWMRWGASPMTMGWGDSFRVTDCWYEDGKWLHLHNGKVKQLNADYITHWMPVPDAPLLVSEEEILVALVNAFRS